MVVCAASASASATSAMVNEQQHPGYDQRPIENSLNKTKSNGSIYHSAVENGNHSTLVQIDSLDSVELSKSPLNGSVLTGLGPPVINDRIGKSRFPIRSILKGAKVHHDSEVAQLKPGILRKAPATTVVVVNEIPPSTAATLESDPDDCCPSPPLVAANLVVHSNPDSSAKPTTINSSTIIDVPSTSAAATTTASTTTTKATKSRGSLQQLSVNNLQVPQPHSNVIKALPRASSLFAQAAAAHAAAAAASTAASTSTSSNQPPPNYPNTTAQRVSDLRRILNPEVEKEDSFKKLSETIENCECFEFNLNNAAKLITVLVLLATLILVIKALKGDR